MGGMITMVYRSPEGKVTPWVHWTNTMPEIFLDVDLGSDPNAVMNPRLEQLIGVPQKKSGWQYGEKLPGIFPYGYGLVVIDALPLTEGKKVKITSCQGYCTPGDVTTSIPFHVNDDPETEKFLNQLFAKFSPVVCGWTCADGIDQTQVIRSTKNHEYVLVDLTADLGNPKTTKQLIRLDRYSKIRVTRFPVSQFYPIEITVEDRDIEFVEIEENNYSALAAALKADGFEIDETNPHWQVSKN